MELFFGMQQYLDLLSHVLKHGNRREDRTGTGTLSIFGWQMRFDLSKGFPLLTTKKLHFKSIAYELLWFIRGDTNIEYLNKNGVSGVRLENYPSTFGTLLNNQAGTIELTTDAVLNKSKQSAYLALLADPVVDNSIEAQKLLDAMIDHQDKYLGYLK